MPVLSDTSLKSSSSYGDVDTVRRFLNDVFDDDDFPIGGGVVGGRSFSQPPPPAPEAGNGGSPKGLRSRTRSETMCKFVRTVFDDDCAGITPSGSDSDILSETTRLRGSSCITMTDEGVEQMMRWADGLFVPPVPVPTPEPEVEGASMFAPDTPEPDALSLSTSSASGCDPAMKKQIADTLAKVKAARLEKKLRKEQVLRSQQAAGGGK
eukprot:TRINITY_DN43943_c0_g1_i1.p1 TRINITY_DN43943_c0_g1~~TRINITY_DN43943_c0_g1_i1.p1  ORF type:complete len:209 (+),score=67.80 TRINITY_DN43943_c0_g1_i1:94-720(+)